MDFVHLGHFLPVKVDESCIPLDLVILKGGPFLLGHGMKKYENIQFLITKTKNSLVYNKIMITRITRMHDLNRKSFNIASLILDHGLQPLRNTDTGSTDSFRRQFIPCFHQSFDQSCLVGIIFVAHLPLQNGLDREVHGIYVWGEGGHISLGHFLFALFLSLIGAPSACRYKPCFQRCALNKGTTSEANMSM